MTSLSLPRIPKILGIVNITEDSFSDGGRYLKTEEAIRHSHELRSEGAAILDLGAASSNPEGKNVDPEEEIRRLKPVIRQLRREKIPVSVDTFRKEVQQFALKEGVEYLNDIQGFPEPELYPHLADSACELILMHSVQRRGRADIQNTDPGGLLPMIEEFFEERIAELEAGGVPRSRIILDPGMGFFLGSHPESSLVVLRNLNALREKFSLPVLISVSRKSFLGAITGRPVPQRRAATLTAEIFAALSGVDYIRTHDVGALRDALLILRALLPSPSEE